MSAVQDYTGVGKACQLCYRRKATKKVGVGDSAKVYCSRCLRMKMLVEEAVEHRGKPANVQEWASKIAADVSSLED